VPNLVPGSTFDAGRELMNVTTDLDLANYLESYMTDERLRKMRWVLERRTRWIQVILEDVFQPHNASAVLRSCDALGVQDVHVVEAKNQYRPNDEIALGSAQWLSLHHHQGEMAIVDTCRQLKTRGVRIVATTPHTQACPIDALPLERGPVALVFGTELTGLSSQALSIADEYVFVPMQGFVESFNLSVCAAICLYSLTTRLRASAIAWQLSAAEQTELWLTWLRSNQKNAAALERRWLAERAAVTKTGIVKT
jgi:tRNA (guanosine-2'-O-)-methyltransferase